MNIIIGPNAQGKTSILEALSLISSLSSFRTTKAAELIREGETQASVTAELIDPTRSKVVIGFDAHKKHIKVDNKEISSKSKYPFLGSCVSFSPDDLYLIKGSPEQRRNFLDELSVSLDSSFSRVLQNFNHVLKQRNKLLKSMKSGAFHYEEYSLWTEKFIEAAIPVYEGRLRFVKTLNESLPTIYKELFKVTETLNVSYLHSLTHDQTLEEALIHKMNQLGEAERAVGYSLVGPHRDDLLVSIHGMNARTHASQGQIRGIVIALKVAQLELTRASRSWSPILLLDDIISELDDKRVKALINFLATYPGQLFVTTAEVDKVKALHSQFSGFKVIDLASEKSSSEQQRIDQISCSNVPSSLG